MKTHHEVFNRFKKFINREKTGTQKLGSASKEEMSRVTDQFGNEYLCPASRLKDPNFVSESEKTRCFDYDRISRNYVS